MHLRSRCGAAYTWYRRDWNRIKGVKPRPNTCGYSCGREEERRESDRRETGTTSSQYIYRLLSRDTRLFWIVQGGADGPALLPSLCGSSHFLHCRFESSAGCSGGVTIPCLLCFFCFCYLVLDAISIFSFLQMIGRTTPPSQPIIAQIEGVATKQVTQIDRHLYLLVLTDATPF